MKNLLFTAFLLISFLSIGFAQTSKEAKKYANPTEIKFETKDGVLLFADLYESRVGKTGPLIMLFHQGGGDARGEYLPMI